MASNANEREVQAARDAVVQAAGHIRNGLPASRAWSSDEIALARAVDWLREFDALQPEPPTEDSRDPELPPRAAEWRARMSRVDAEGGC